MKKTLLTLGVVAAASAAFGQGTVEIEDASTSPGVAVEQWSDSAVISGSSGTSASDWYGGAMTLQLYYTADSATGESQVAAINAAEQSGGNTSSTAVAQLLAGDTDFTLVNMAGIQGTGGTVDAAGTGLNVTSAGGVFQATVTELSNVPAAAAGDWILVGTATIGTQNYEGLVGFSDMSSGGSYTAKPPGTYQDDLNAWNAAGINLDLAPVSSPEPATIALAGLGGLSMLFLRRRKA